MRSRLRLLFYGLFVALALDEIVRGVLMLVRFKGGRWRTKKVIKSN